MPFFGSIVLYYNHDSFVVFYFTRVCVLLQLYEILYDTLLALVLSKISFLTVVRTPPNCVFLTVELH